MAQFVNRISIKPISSMCRPLVCDTSFNMMCSSFLDMNKKINRGRPIFNGQRYQAMLKS